MSSAIEEIRGEKEGFAFCPKEGFAFCPKGGVQSMGELGASTSVVGREADKPIR